MGRRKQPELMDAGTRRASMLAGVSDKVAVQLYDEGMAALAARGDDSFASAALLRDAVQWTEVIDRLQHALLFEVSRGDDADDKAIAQLMRRKQAAEDARRRALASLMLVPQRLRGRPPKTTQGEAAQEDSEDDGWDSFGAGSGGADGDDGA
ncbi:MAG: hypothetical protein ACI4MU_13250 [Candidatus Ventricola sp.]